MAEELYPSIMEPSLYRQIEIFCRVSLQYSANHANIRSGIGSLIFRMNQIAEKKYGHASTEVVALRYLLDRTHPKHEILKNRQRESLDPVEILKSKGMLSGEQTDAARVIEDVWRAFGRLMSVGARNYESGSGGKRAKPVGPVDIMGPTILNSWHDHYTPWYENANHRWVTYKKDPKPPVSKAAPSRDILPESPVGDKHFHVEVSEEEGKVVILVRPPLIVFAIVIEGYSPWEVDASMAKKHRGKWRPGLAYTVLCDELDRLSRFIQG